MKKEESKKKIEPDFIQKIGDRIDTYERQGKPFKNRLYNFWSRNSSVESTQNWFGEFAYSKYDKIRALNELRTYMAVYAMDPKMAVLPNAKDIMVLCDGTTKDFLLENQNVLPVEFKLSAYQIANIGFKEYDCISAFTEGLARRLNPN